MKNSELVKLINELSDNMEGEMWVLDKKYAHERKGMWAINDTDIFGEVTHNVIMKGVFKMDDVHEFNQPVSSNIKLAVLLRNALPQIIAALENQNEKVDI